MMTGTMTDKDMMTAMMTGKGMMTNMTTGGPMMTTAMMTEGRMTTDMMTEGHMMIAMTTEGLMMTGKLLEEKLLDELLSSHSIQCLNLNVKRFTDQLKVPHIGWNQLSDPKSDLFKSLKEGDYVYYVHSYYIPDNEYSIASTEYGISYSGALRKDNFYACQFHPEKSGAVGATILKNFIES